MASMARVRSTFWFLFVATACTGTITGPGGGGSGGDDDGIGGDWGGNLPDDDDPVTPTSQKLVIETPARGAMIAAADASTVRVAGRVLEHEPDEELTINGEAVDIAGDGSFTHELTPRAGANIVAATLTGSPGARAQRSFLYGTFAGMDQMVRAAAALRVNQDGFSDGDPDIDDLSALVSAAVAQRDVIKLLPRTYDFDAPVVGNVDVTLEERTSGATQVVLTPRAGGVHAVARVPNVRVRHRLVFDCAITTCNETGTATADAIEVGIDLDVSLFEGTVSAASKNATVNIVNFRNDQDGAVASAAQAVVEYFVDDLEGKIEAMLEPGIASATSTDFSVAVGGLSVPASIDLRPALDLDLELAQELDTLDFTATGALLGIGLRATAQFDAGDPGASAPGWLVQGGAVGDYRLDPPFGVSTAMDLVNQLLFAVWGQGAFQLAMPVPQLGETSVTLAAPPVFMPEPDGQSMLVVAGDIVLDSTFNGDPIQLVVAVVTRARLVADAASSRARIELIDEPVLYAEMTEGPNALTGLLLTTLVEEAGPALVGELLGAVAVPLPALPLDPVADSLAGKVLRIAPPAEFVTGEPPARVTLYGRLEAQ